MKQVERISGRAIPLGLKNVDTDVILPGPYLKTITRKGLGRVAFESIRAKPGNIFEELANQGANILIAGDNFGCGSSREHAVWAIMDMGIDAVIAPSFSDIFSGNAFKNGLLTVTLPQSTVDELLEEATKGPLIVDLADQSVSTEDNRSYAFEFDAFRKHCLLNGLDEVSLTLAQEDAIAAFESRSKLERPWLPAVA
ncbi:3-isopropylmalate dehydratase small subunit [Sphingobium chlorophenolicum L-1]|uniref:3-isopropylmalate dehydratase small subunit n=1 Tax=Sphingobium chlorophenolicum L-1 TaxID=690566 RepID=F6F381_SPHCR|nr:3-isopropylmalate dehydratase small subunit [Sphingobium chlorophenolicum]AEG50893.1 3-isopropylmalate dehydratase small subunit [Sphingobium chlorophenolicum L-1]